MVEKAPVTLKEVASLINRDVSTACRWVKTCRDALGKKEHQKVSFREFADYYGLTL